MEYINWLFYECLSTGSKIMNNCIDLTFGNYFPTWINDRVCQTYVWRLELTPVYYTSRRYSNSNLPIAEPPKTKFKTYELVQLAVL